MPPTAVPARKRLVSTWSSSAARWGDAYLRTREILRLNHDGRNLHSRRPIAITPGPSNVPSGPQDGHDTEHGDHKAHRLRQRGNVQGKDENPDDGIRGDKAREVLELPTRRIAKAPPARPRHRDPDGDPGHGAVAPRHD